MEKILDKFTKALKSKFNGEISKIILFGSRSKDIARPDSDYDLLVVLFKKDPRIVNRIYDEVLAFLLKYEVDISLKIYSDENFRKGISVPTPFMEEIKQTGVELWASRIRR